MKYILSIILTFWVAFASAQTSKPAPAEGGAAEPSQQGGVVAKGQSKCPECDTHVKDPYNGPTIRRDTNPDTRSEQGRPGSGGTGIDGDGD